jgi:hypothetical protein
MKSKTEILLLAFSILCGLDFNSKFKLDVNEDIYVVIEYLYFSILGLNLLYLSNGQFCAY